MSTHGWDEHAEKREKPSGEKFINRVHFWKNDFEVKSRSCMCCVFERKRERLGIGVDKVRHIIIFEFQS